MIQIKRLRECLLVVSGKRVTRLLVVFVGSCSGYPIINRVVFGSRVTTWLIIGSGSCRTRLCNRVSRVDTNPTRELELPTLGWRWRFSEKSEEVSRVEAEARPERNNAIISWVKVQQPHWVQANVTSVCSAKFISLQIQAQWEDASLRSLQEKLSLENTRKLVQL